MSEYDAHTALCASGRLRALPSRDPLEDTQRMPVLDRRYRQFEAKTSHELHTVEYAADDVHDFRDGRREHRLTVHEIAQQDGFPDE